MLARVAWFVLAVGATILLSIGCSGPDGVSAAKPDQDAGRTLAQILAEVDQAAVPDGVDPAVYEELRTELAAVLSARDVSKFTSAPPADDRSITLPVFDSNTGELSWRYYCTGDYNQNGLVEVADLTPLGQNYNAMGPFPSDSAMSVVDGNTDGAITVGDITPIGQNYGCMVTEYNVYGSDVQADYPATAAAGNGGATLLDTIAFASAVNNPGERLLFSVTVTQPMSYYWVRPVDGTTEGVASDLVTASGGGPVVVNPAVLHPDLGTARLAGPVIVDGNPAIVYVTQPDGGDGSLYFQRAIDADGTDWDNPILLDVGLNGWDKPSLAIIDGHPAVTYQNNNTLWYYRSGDAQGTSWGQPVIAENDYDSNGEHNILREVNGQPAVVFTYYSGGTQSIGYKRADDARGDSWTAADKLLNAMPAGARINAISFEMVGGAPGVAYTFEGMDWGGTDYRGALYVTSTDMDGDAWGSGNLVHRILDSEPGYMRTIQVLDLDGLPGVVTFMEVWPTETASIAWFSTTPQRVNGSFAAPDVIFGPGHSTAEAGDILKNVTAFTVTVTEGVVAMVVPTYKDAEGEYNGILWAAPVETGVALDWETKAVQLQEFTQPKAVGSLKLPMGKQASCYCSFADADALAQEVGDAIKVMFLSAGFPEGMSFVTTHWTVWIFLAAIVKALFSVG